MEKKPEVNVQHIQLLMQKNIERMNHAAEELRQELGLPPGAKYELLQMLYGSGSPIGFSTEVPQPVMSTEQPQLSVRGGSSMLSTGIAQGRYRLIRELGHGTFGTVYLAQDTLLDNREVAIKVLTAQLSDPVQQQKFRDEANIIARWDHPNIVRILDTGIEGQTPFFVMSYAPNGTLRQHHPMGTTIPLGQVVLYVKQIAIALQYAHDQKIIHRDVKPENLLLGRNMEILLSDFGIAAVAPMTTTVLGQLPVEPAGTPLYMAPEQFDGDLSRRSDQYSLAIIAYEWLCGTPPFTSSSIQLAYQHRVVNPPSLCERAPTIPPSVEQVIMKALAKDRTQRYDRVEEFAAALEKAATPVPVSDTPRHWDRRDFLKIVGTVAALAAVGAGGAAALKTIFTPPPPTTTVQFLYSTEKQNLIQAAVKAFNKQGFKISNGNRIQVVLIDEQGSVNAMNKILNALGNLPGSLKPTAWSPASTLEVNLLATNWTLETPIISDQEDLRPRSIVSSPLVFAVFKDRVAQLFKGEPVDWNVLNPLVKTGKVRFGNTRPDESNSGLLSITLIAYNYFGVDSRLKAEQLKNQHFLRYLDDFEGGVTEFGRSSGTFLNECVTENTFDVVTTYESLVLTDPEKRFHMFYPNPNLVSDHPFALLQAPWVKPEEQEAAKIFRTFLLSESQQQAALTHGFRPSTNNSDPTVRITDNIPSNVFLPFLKSGNSGFQQTIPDSAQYPSGPVVKALIQTWINAYGSSSTCTG